MRFILPTIYGTGANPINGLEIIVSSYPDGFGVEEDISNGKVITYSQVVSIDLDKTLNQIKNGLENQYTQVRNKLDALTLKPMDVLAGLSHNGTSWS